MVCVSVSVLCCIVCDIFVFLAKINDCIQASLLSIFFALGIVIFSMYQKSFPSLFSGLQSFLFGSAASLLIEDVQLIFLLMIVTLSSWFLLRRRLTLFLFDREQYHYIYGSSLFLESVFFVLIIANITVGLRAVGIILMGPLLVFPALIAESFSRQYALMAFWSIVFGSAICLFGSLMSLILPGLPTGPTIVILFSSMLLVCWLRQAVAAK